MRLKNTIRKFFAILLIVVFSLKAGVGLSLHNYFHAKHIYTASQSASTEIKYVCSCFTDFCLPLTEITQPKIGLTFFTYKEHLFYRASSIFCTTIIYHSLRAPPAAC